MSDFRYVTLTDLLSGLADSGIGLTIRDVGLLEAGLARPQATVFGQDAYPDAWTKSAALMHSLVTSHPFVDGNKRAGLAGALATLAINGIDTAGGDHEALYSLTLDVAGGKANDISEIAPRLRTALNTAL